MISEEKSRTGMPAALMERAAPGEQIATLRRERVSIEDDYQRARPAFEADFAARAKATDADGQRRTFAQAEPNYRAGFVAGHDLEYEGRTFEEIEPELRHEYEISITDTGERTSGATGWDRLREEIRTGFRAARDRLY